MPTQTHPVLIILLLLAVFPGCKSDAAATNDDTTTDSNVDDSDLIETDSDDADGEASDSGSLDTDSDMTKIGMVPFDDSRILTYHITMDDAMLTDMQENGDDEEYRAVALAVTGDGVNLAFPEVGLRYKGDYSLHHCWDSGRRRYSGECAKLSMKLKFSEYDKDERFDGLKRINLHAMSEDGSKMRERLSYEMYDEFGVDAPRTAYAQVQFNEEPPFLVLAVEQVDGRYTAHHYPPNGDGDVYKEIWPRDTLMASTAREGLRTNDDPEDNPNIERMLAFGEAVSASTPETFVDAVSPFVDITHLLRYMAVDRAIKNWDGITAFYWRERPHNFYWYLDTLGTEKFWMIPWDMDKTFWLHDPYMDPDVNEVDIPLPNWNVRPAACDYFVTAWNEFAMNAPGCDPLIHGLAVTGWDEFAGLGQELLDGPFQLSVVDGKVTQWQNQIGELVAADPFIATSSWEYDVDELRTILETYISDFATHLEEGYWVME